MIKKKKVRKNELLNSGAEGTRTLYLIAASDALSQVSYDPGALTSISQISCLSPLYLAAVSIFITCVIMSNQEGV